MSVTSAKTESQVLRNGVCSVSRGGDNGENFAEMCAFRSRLHIWDMITRKAPEGPDTVEFLVK